MVVNLSGTVTGETQHSCFLPKIQHLSSPEQLTDKLEGSRTIPSKSTMCFVRPCEPLFNMFSASILPTVYGVFGPICLQKKDTPRLPMSTFGDIIERR